MVIASELVLSIWIEESKSLSNMSSCREETGSMFKCCCYIVMNLNLIRLIHNFRNFYSGTLRFVRTPYLPR